MSVLRVVLSARVVQTQMRSDPDKDGACFAGFQYTMMGSFYKALLFISHKASVCLLPFITWARKSLCLYVV